jgi:signal transduction histidine kinase
LSLVDNIGSCPPGSRALGLSENRGLRGTVGLCILAPNVKAISERKPVNLKLSSFILSEIDSIVAEWEIFAAAQLPAAAQMGSLALRDHAEQILQTVAKDTLTAQTVDEQSEKSKGRAPRPRDAPNTAAEMHALLRAQSGFSINQLAAEYRALRASVLSLWTKKAEPNAVDPQDMIRFNEAIDQAVAESVAFFNAQIDNERNLLLGTLGHDMRSPLHVIQLTAMYLSKMDAGTDVATCAARLLKSTSSLKALLDDLLDFNRTKLGLGITISPAAVDLAEAFSAELEQLRVANAGRLIALEANGEVSGVWDINRLNQLLGNLVVNALKYGASSSPVRIVLNGLAGEVTFAVHNHGPKIEQSMLAQIFEPLKRGSDGQLVSGTDGSMGLGLYIAREIATAHGGDIAAKSDENETVFTVRLPRLRA